MSQHSKLHLGKTFPQFLDPLFVERSPFPLTGTVFCRKLEFPKEERPCRSLYQRPRAGENRGVFCLCHLRTSWGDVYKSAEQRPVSVRTGSLSSAGERCSVSFCTL